MSFTFERLAWRLRTTRPSGRTHSSTASPSCQRTATSAVVPPCTTRRRRSSGWRWATGRRAPRGGAEVPGVVPRRGPHSHRLRGIDRGPAMLAGQCDPRPVRRRLQTASRASGKRSPPTRVLRRLRNPPRTLLHHRGVRRTDAGARTRSRASGWLAKVDSKGFVPEAARATERLNPCLTAKRSGYGVLAVRQGFEPWEEVNAPSTV